MAKRKKEKEADMRSDGLKQLSNIICATPAKKRGKKFNEMVDVTALLATITRGVELCSQGGSVDQFKEIILDMRRACEKSVQYMTFRDFMSGDVHKGASRLGYKMKLRNLKPMEVNPSAGLVDHLRKVSDNVIMDVESARELLIYPIMVEAVSEVPDVFLRVQPELSAELKVDGVTTVISGNPDMTAGTLKLEGSSTKAHLRNFLKHGFASIREHFCLGEWKRSSEFDEGQGQLFAQMAAARAKSSSKVPAVVNGLLADGDRFIFSTLEGDTFYVSDIFERGTNLGQIIAYLRVAMSGKPLPAVGKDDSSSPLTVPSSNAGYPQSPHDSSVFTAAPVPLNYGKTSKRKKESKEKKTKIDTSLIKTEPETKRTKSKSKSKSTTKTEPESKTKTEPESKTKRIKTEPETKRIKTELETKRTKKERN